MTSIIKFNYLGFLLFFDTVTSATFGSKTSGTHMITNGLCSFSPTSTKGKWIFMIQTVVLSFTPIIILLIQNGASFYEIMMEKEHIFHKNALVRFFSISIFTSIQITQNKKINCCTFLSDIRFKVRWAFQLSFCLYNGNAQLCLYPFFLTQHLEQQLICLRNMATLTGLLEMLSGVHLVPKKYLRIHCVFKFELTILGQLLALLTYINILAK